MVDLRPLQQHQELCAARRTFQDGAGVKGDQAACGRLDKEETIDLFSKFCDVPKIPAVAFARAVKAYMAMKAQKQHDAVMRQPHGHSRI